MELVTNSYGHAFPDRDGTIVVTLACTHAGRATITIQDDGVGFEVKAESTRRGLGLVRRLMERVGGTFDIQRDNGTLWSLAFTVPVPYSAPKAAA